MNKKLLILIAILTVAAFLRFFHLAEIPSILNRDEAAIAYNAYLLSEKGVDEWGKTWPLTLKSFGDYKLPGYPVLLAFLFRLGLPLEDWVVKLPSLLSGLGILLVAYFIAKDSELLERQRLHLVFMLSSMPVFLFYSRIAFEANLAFFLFISSIYLLFFAKVKRKTPSDILAALLYLGAILTYNTPLLLLPFILPALIFYRGVKNYKKWLTPFALLILVFIFGFASFLSLSQQKAGITIFSDPTVTHQWLQHRENFDNSISQKLFASKYLFYLLIIFRNFLSSFSPHFLVINGGSHPWHSLPEYGHMYWTVYVFAFFGIFWSVIEVFHYLRLRYLAKKRHRKISNQRQAGIGHELLLLYFLTISLLPAIVTTDAPHATRSLFFFFLLAIFAVLGVEDLYHFKIFRSKIITRSHVVTLFFATLTALELLFYSRAYFLRYLELEPWSLHPGFQENIAKIDRKYPLEKVAIIDNEGYQYILTSWYAKISAEEYLETNIRQNANSLGFFYGEQVGRYHFYAQREDVKDEAVILEWREPAKDWSIEEN